MKRLLVLLLLAAGLMASRSSFAQCPPPDVDGSWTGPVSSTFTLSPSGCQITIKYCYRDVLNGSSFNGWERQFYVSEVDHSGTGCSGLTLPVILHAAADSLIKTITSLPLCDQGLAGQVVTTTLNSCWSLVDNNGVRTASPCGTGFCKRTCSLCYFYNVATQKYDYRISDCVFSETVGDGCTELVPPCAVSYNTCYHIPCWTGRDCDQGSSGGNNN
jgi:hypothetical protein